ncbi:MAG: rhodanese-like domain-containing protein [Flammeovirgaceae bacterium]
METKRFLLLVVIFTTASVVYAQSDYDKKLKSLYRHTVKTISPTDAKKLVGNPKAVFIDTRSPEEFKVSHLPKARFLNYNNYSTNDLKRLPKDCKLIVYCSVGYRSEHIGEKLLKLGYTNVVSLYGGIFEWKNQGLDVYNSSNYPTDSVHTYSKSWGKWLVKGIKVY